MRYILFLVLLFVSIASFGQTLLHSAIDKISKQNFRGALMDCNKAIEANPYLGESYQVRGVAKVGLADYMGAIKDCNKAISLKPGIEFMAGAYTWRGIAKYMLGDKKSGCEDMSKGGEMGNDQAYLFISNYCN